MTLPLHSSLTFTQIHSLSSVYRSEMAKRADKESKIRSNLWEKFAEDVDKDFDDAVPSLPPEGEEEKQEEV